MAIPSRQIGWSTQSNLLWEISKQLEQLICVTAGGCGTTTTTTTTVAPGWTFVPNEISVFPANSDGYTLYEGAWTAYDNGQIVDPVSYAGEFFTDGVGDTQFILRTNGYMYGVINSLGIFGNGGDLFITPGDPLNDGDIQNFFYQNITSGAKWKTSILVYCGRCCGTSQEIPYSYIINIYRDANFQYIETCIKTNAGDNTGPGTNTEPPNIATQVWQSDLTGVTWTLLGFGSVL